MWRVLSSPTLCFILLHYFLTWNIADHLSIHLWNWQHLYIFQVPCMYDITKIYDFGSSTCGYTIFIIFIPRWRHQMETFSASLAICARNSPVIGEFRAQRPVTRSFDVFFDLRPNKHWWGWWIETPSHPLWRHCNAGMIFLPEYHVPNLHCGLGCGNKVT